MGYNLKSIRVALAATLLLSALAQFTFCTSAQAAETINYAYDALGRVKSATHVGGDNTGLVINYTYDPAGNRTQYQVTGSKNKGRPDGVIIVVPLNGFTIIPVGM
jgi:YD repeat-containing protein